MSGTSRTVVRCRVMGCENWRGDPDDLVEHTESFHSAEAAELRALGVEWEEPPRAKRGKYLLPSLVLTMLRRDPGRWMRVFTAEFDGATGLYVPKDYNGPATQCRKNPDYSDLEFRPGLLLDTPGLYARCKP